MPRIYLDILPWTIIFTAGSTAGGIAGHYYGEWKLEKTKVIAQEDSLRGKSAMIEVEHHSPLKSIAYGMSLGGLGSLVLYGAYRESRNKE